MREMIPIKLTLRGVRAFGNHTVNLGGPEVHEILMFGPNGSGKSTIARMIQALVGDIPDDLQRSFLDERDTRVNRRASAEMVVLNPKGDDIRNPDWPEEVTLGLEFGYENNRSYSRYYTVIDGKRQNYRTHEEYAAMFRRPPYSIKADDRFMFIQQGESAALVQMRPRQRYETMKQFLGLEDLESRWQETLDAKKRTMRELNEAVSLHNALQTGLEAKEIAARRLEQYRTHWTELQELELALARDDLLRLVDRLGRAIRDEARLASTLEGETRKRDSLLEEVRLADEEAKQCVGDIEEASALLVLAKDRQTKANNERQAARGVAEEKETILGSLERIASEGLSLEDLERSAREIEAKMSLLGEHIQAKENDRTILGRQLDDRYRDLALAEEELRRMEADLESAQKVIGENEELPQIQARIGPARADLSTRRVDLYAARTSLEECEKTLLVLKANETTMPAEALAARDAYIAKGIQAAVLGDVVVPPPNLSREELLAIEGALGDLRWAVLLGDGRVFVNYEEYSISWRTYCPYERPDRPLNNVASRLMPLEGIHPQIENLLQGVLEMVVFIDDHEKAAAWGGKGLVAYTPDGYRYDRYGRRYSVPQRLSVGRAAYLAALREAKEAFACAKARVQETETAMKLVEQTLSRLELAEKNVTSALSVIGSVGAALPGARKKKDDLDTECQSARSHLDGLLQELDALKKERVLGERDASEIRAKIERVKRLSELPRITQERDEARQREGRARRAAEAAIEEVRAHEARIEKADRRRKELELDIQRYQERLQDFGPRITDTEHMLEEKRRDKKEAFLSVPMVAAQWQQAVGAQELSDEETLAAGEQMLSESGLATQEDRITWTGRVAEVRPVVLALKDQVIETAEEDYVSAQAEFQRADEDYRRVQEAFTEASSREEIAQDHFKKVMHETFGRVSSRFQGYLGKFGWTGYASVEPVQDTQFDLQIYLSVYEGTEPRPVARNRSGGETSAIAALLTLAMVKEYRRPFYIFDEIDQSLDPANVLKLGAILRQEIGRKYIVISHRLNRTHLEQGQFGIGVYRSANEGSRTRVYQRKDAVRDDHGTP